MENEIDALRQRVQQLEQIALEYSRLEHLISDAIHGKHFEWSNQPKSLFVDPATLLILDATDAALELLGYSREKLIGLSITDLEQPTSACERLLRTYTETAIETNAYETEFRHLLGHHIPVEVFRRVIDTNNRNLLYYRLEDHSLYAQLWKELQRRDDEGYVFQQKLRILNEITIELSHTDTFDGLCRHAVELCIERLGFDRIGMWFLDKERGVMVGSYGVDEQGSLRDERGQSWSYEGTYILEFMRGKTEASLVQDHSPIYNDRSEIIGYGWHISAPMLHGDQFIGIMTADNYLHKQPMKNYEPELLRLYGITFGHLTELARARNQAFAIRLEQERTQMLRQFIMKVGHDFRTPLSIINTHTYLLERVQDPQRRYGLAHDIGEQVKYIHTLLDRMLEFVALERDLALTFTPTNLCALLQEIVTVYQSAVDAKHLRCELEFDAPMFVPADARYLRRALSELIQNAIQYTPADGWIRISLAHYGNEVGIRIEDSGIGIAPQNLDKLFSALYRIDEARTERRSGLGLAIAQRIVEAHSGRIVVESTLGKGSTFVVLLPQ